MPGILTQAAIDDPALRAAYTHCRRSVRRDDPVEYSIMQLMPPALRPACWAMWAAFSAADDAADAQGDTNAGRAARLLAWTSALESELAAGHSDDPVRRALIDTMWRWRLDPADLQLSFSTLDGDTRGRSLQTWHDWSAWVGDSNLSWAAQSMTLLARAGVPVPLWLRRKDAYQRYLDGLYLTDTLTDLAHDLARDDLSLPAEILDRFPHAADHLRRRHWSPAVRDLVTHLTEQARRWLNQPGLTGALHPGPAEMLRTATRLFHARLDAVQAAGPALLSRPAVPSALLRWRILAPARTRAAVAWRLTPLIPPPPAQNYAPAFPVPRQVRSPHALQPPPAHPSGTRPPAIPADRMPRHVAVIMDGNGRWATRRGLSRHEGHRIGADIATREIIYGAAEIGLSHLSLYAFSTENWKRDTQEIAYLFETLREQLREDIVTSDPLGIRLRWAGRTDGLPEDLVEELLQAELATRHRTGLTLTVCVNYGGRAELTQAAAQLARTVTTGDLHPDRMTEDDLARHLPWPDTPDVDLLWRTGGERRISNFLLWQAAYAELHFTDDHWPDVDRRDLWQALTEYSTRQRRHGAVPASARTTDGCLIDNSAAH
ncbi:polyprenyl diphosphate synthase [Streptomyces chryseus]